MSGTARPRPLVISVIVALLAILVAGGDGAAASGNSPGASSSPGSGSPPAASAPVAGAECGTVSAGVYEVTGRNRQGRTYGGAAVIAIAGGKVAMSWLLASGEKYSGHGTVEGRRLVVEWGAGAPVIYEIESDGTLNGTWDNGRGTETLVLQRP